MFMSHIWDAQNRAIFSPDEKHGAADEFSNFDEFEMEQFGVEDERGYELNFSNTSQIVTKEECKKNIELISSFLSIAKEMEKDAKFALNQSKSMAKMQVQIESTNATSSLIINKTLSSLEESSVVAEETDRDNSATAQSKETSIEDRLRSLSSPALHKVINNLNKAIETTNLQLMENLVLKDSLKTQQTILLSKIEDITKHAENQLHELQIMLVTTTDKQDSSSNKQTTSANTNGSSSETTNEQ